MTTGILSLDDVQSSGTTSGNDSGTNSGSDSASDSSTTNLEAACEAIGADLDHARRYIAEHGNQSGVIELAEAIAEEPERICSIYEEYRNGTDLKRILENYLYDHDVQYTVWADSFWGNSDDPDEGTYNYVQQRARADDVPGNQLLYKALFPEPRAEFYPGEPVLWMEFDQIGYPTDEKQDSHIYVAREFVEEYGQFQMEVGGKSRPRPPNDNEVAELTGDNESASSSGSSESSGGVSDMPDPRAYTISEFEEMVGDLSLVECNEALNLEKDNSDHAGGRKGIKTLLYDRIDTLESRDESSSGSDEPETSDDSELMTVEIDGKEVTGEKSDIMQLLG